MRYVLVILLLLPTLAACTPADLKVFNDVLQTAGADSTGLSDSDITAGLKEALATGTERSISRIGRLDGFWQNAALRIPLPDTLEKAEKILRTLGQGRTVDEFQLSLNRAAEQAVPEAASIFGAAIREMSLADARGILSGPDNAATTYFQQKTTAALTARFKPVVTRATESVGATHRYKDVIGKAGRLVSGLDASSLDLDAYVTDRALSGLFTTLADEERKIRENPAARTSELLKKVFGNR